jgi:hypothetical protein
VTPADWARAVRAGRGSSPPLPGGFRENARPALRPVCDFVAGLGQAEAGNTRFSATTQEARSGAERRRWLAATSTAVERRQASAPR